MYGGRSTWSGRSYFHFVGRDASAFATGCTQPACLVPHLDGLSELEGGGLLGELYEFHDKYTYVGKLVSEDPVSDAVDAAMREEEALREVELEASSNSGAVLSTSALVDALEEGPREIHCWINVGSDPVLVCCADADGKLDRGC